MLKKLIVGFILLAIMFIGFLYLQSHSNVEISDSVIELDGKRIQFETNKGSFEITLYAKLAPKTISNFIQYVKAGFYNGTIFHRVIPGVIIQGGGFNSEMKEKETQLPVLNESNNGLSNRLGSVAMARRGAADSATSQFYINLKDNKELDYSKEKPGFTVFAQVTDGLELLIDLSKQKSISIGAHENIPSDEIKLISVSLVSDATLKEIENTTSEGVDKNVELNQSAFKEGVHYQVLASPLSLTNTSKVGVISAFSYGCGHCYGSYAQVEAWKKGHLKEVDFSYFHAVWNSAMRIYAQTYYTAIELKVQKKIHIPLFETILVNQKKLENKEDLAAFFEHQGIQKKQFIETFESDRIDKRVIQAEKLTKKFQLASVPEFVVAGKYRVNPMMAGGQNEMFELLDFLIKKELANRP